MASSQTDINMSCPMCFGSQDVLKVVGRCKHIYCMTCLTLHLQRQKSRETKFPCPMCNTDCFLPNGGLDGLVDFTGAEEVTDVPNDEPQLTAEHLTASSSADKNIQRDLDSQTVLDVKCQICHHRKLEVQAANLCPDCDQLHLCKDCTAVHAKGRATKDHTVVALKIQATEGEAICVDHNAPLTKYCSTCGKPACKICVMLEHGDHDIEILSNVIVRKVQELEVEHDQREDEMKQLKCLKNEIGSLKTAAPHLDRQDVLIKEVEDHAKKWVNHIVKWKKNIEKEIKEELQIIKDIPDAYEAASNITNKLEKPLKKAARLLSKTEQHPSYLKKLISVQQELDAVPKMAYEMVAEKYYKSLRELLQTNLTFHPEAVPSFTIGKLDLETANIFQPKEIFSETLEVDSKDKYIPCVASLGKKYAIAHPTIQGQPASAIDIYEFPGKFCRTMTNEVKPVYDMTSTYKGNLAVLSDGNKGTSSCSIKVLDLENGNNLSTFNLDIGKPMSIGFGLQNQYVILSAILSVGQQGKRQLLSVGQQGKRQITIVDVDGNVECEHMMHTNPELRNPTRISCGLWQIFVMGENGVAVNKIQGTEFAQTDIISDWIVHQDYVPSDIAASLWDHLLLVGQFMLGDIFFLIKYSEADKKEPWEGQCRSVLRGVSEADRCRIATSDYHIVASFGQKFSVYEYQD